MCKRCIQCARSFPLFFCLLNRASLIGVNPCMFFLSEVGWPAWPIDRINSRNICLLVDGKRNGRQRTVCTFKL